MKCLPTCCRLHRPVILILCNMYRGRCRGCEPEKQKDTHLTSHLQSKFGVKFCPWTSFSLECFLANIWVHKHCCERPYSHKVFPTVRKPFKFSIFHALGCGIWRVCLYSLAFHSSQTLYKTELIQLGAESFNELTLLYRCIYRGMLAINIKHIFHVTLSYVRSKVKCVAVRIPIQSLSKFPEVILDHLGMHLTRPRLHTMMHQDVLTYTV